MKRIIAFVFLGILIYAGIFVFVYGVGEYVTAAKEPISLSMTLHDGLPIEDKVDHQYGMLGKKTNQTTLLGIPIGNPTITYFYIISIGDHPDYLLLAVTDPEDINAIENAAKGNEFKFTGVLKNMNPSTSVLLRDFLFNHPVLIGTETLPYGAEIVAARHIKEYVIYVCDLKGPDAVPVIVGAAIFLVGAGLAALLIVRIVRERTGY